MQLAVDAEGEYCNESKYSNRPRSNEMIPKAQWHSFWSHGIKTFITAHWLRDRPCAFATASTAFRIMSEIWLSAWMEKSVWYIEGRNTCPLRSRRRFMSAIKQSMAKLSSHRSWTRVERFCVSRLYLCWSSFEWCDIQHMINERTPLFRLDSVNEHEEDKVPWQWLLILDSWREYCKDI